jgi:hypothetical protein
VSARQQQQMPELIVHEPMRPPRRCHIGENVYADRWRELMAQVPEDADYDTPEAVAHLREILSPMWYEIGQREATVAASFICWLGTNCGRCFLGQARKRRADKVRQSTLTVWTEENYRHTGINHGIRTIEYLLAPPHTIKNTAITSPEKPLTELPDISLRDAEVIEHICEWLDTEKGMAFVMRCEREILRLDSIQREISRRRNDPERVRAELIADQNERRGEPCHVRRWHRGEHGWFVVRDDDYARVWPA